MDKKPNHYQQALDLAEAGRHREALERIQEYLTTAPDDAEAVNDAGAVLHCLERYDEAIEHLLRARALCGDSAEIVWNLVEAYLAAGRPKEAIPLFEDMEKMGILSPDVLNRTADVFLNQGGKTEAIELLRHSLQVCPEQEILKPMIEILEKA